jgi:hypothetical protein
VTDECKAVLQVGEEVQKTSGRTYRGIEFAATPSLCVQPWRVAADVSGDATQLK